LVGAPYRPNDSGYAPQLAAKLNITSTQSNLVGLGGNLGVYLTGPL
jgi:hypothetical protein